MREITNLMESKEHQTSPLRPANCVARIVVGVLVIMVASIVLLESLSWLVRVTRRVDLTVVTQPETGYRFPDPREVDSVEVRSASGDNESDLPNFNLSKGSWSRILSCLTPWELDPHPAKWASIGYLKIRTKQGEECCVELYDTHTATIGAFSAGPNFESRTYFRGGNSSQLRARLRRLMPSQERENERAVAAVKGGGVRESGAGSGLRFVL